MAGYEVDFLGCKISHTDAQAIGDALDAAGHEPDANGAGVRVVNTCCITAEAEKKSRQRVRRMLGSEETRHVFVTGCGAANRPEQYERIDEWSRCSPAPPRWLPARSSRRQTRSPASAAGVRRPASRPDTTPLPPARSARVRAHS